jgi:hypothetical protein
VVKGTHLGIYEAHCSMQPKKNLETLDFFLFEDGREMRPQCAM